jgi:asparagine synthase (glutamine-hydrolysing)
VLRAAARPARLDRASVLGLIAFGQFDSYRSFFRDVALVPPYASVNPAPAGTLRWSTPAGPARRAATSEEAARLVVETLLDVVRRALRHADRPAVALSGGLDSSAVAWAAAQAWRELGRRPADLAAYHQLPASGPTEERHARTVAAALGIRFHAVSSRPCDPWDGSEALLRRLPFPPDGGGLAELLTFQRRLRDDGVDVLLTGDGGDEAFDAHADDEIGPAGRALRRVLGPLVRPLRAARRRRQARGTLPDWLRVRVGRSSPPEASPVPRTGLFGAAAARDRLLRCARQQTIVALYDGLDALHGTRTVVPLLDRALVDLVVSLPSGTLAVDGRPKGLLRYALAGRLPETVVARPKDQPYAEPARVGDLARYGAAWDERFLRGGLLEQADVLPRSAAADLIRDGGRGDLAALTHVHAALGLEAWADAKALAL